MQDARMQGPTNSAPLESRLHTIPHVVYVEASLSQMIPHPVLALCLVAVIPAPLFTPKSGSYLLHLLSARSLLISLACATQASEHRVYLNFCCPRVTLN